MKKELIIFDMDGTLINSGNVITNTINFVRVNLGLQKLEPKLMLETLNNPDINSAEYFYGTKEFTAYQTELFTKYYDENCTKDIELYDGIYNLLELLSKNYKLSVATNASREFAIQMLEALDINKFFDFVIGANMVEYPKPKPDMLIKTLESLNIEAKNSILIGDSRKDTMSADAINMDNILVNWGFSNHSDAINNIDELEKELKNV